MPELSMRKRLQVVRFFLQGFSYEEIVYKTGVSKGSVVNVSVQLV